MWDRFTVSTNNVPDIIKEIEDFTKTKLEYLTQGNEAIYDGDVILKSNIDFNHNITALLGEEFILPIYMAVK